MILLQKVCFFFFFSFLIRWNNWYKLCMYETSDVPPLVEALMSGVESVVCSFFSCVTSLVKVIAVYHLALYS